MVYSVDLFYHRNMCTNNITLIYVSFANTAKHITVCFQCSRRSIIAQCVLLLPQNPLVIQQKRFGWVMSHWSYNFYGHTYIWNSTKKHFSQTTFKETFFFLHKISHIKSHSDPFISWLQENKQKNWQCLYSKSTMDSAASWPAPSSILTLSTSDTSGARQYN